jgi:hypothetical protein
MPDREPASADTVTEDAATPAPWARARDHLEGARATYWLATVRPSGAPDVMPLLAVWVDGGLFFCGEREPARPGTLRSLPLRRHPGSVVLSREGAVSGRKRLGLTGFG